ncbi:MAG TPA: LysR substrate-binding domain-containing protein [Burkholderiaceae bacterium]|nr:LysR substrate-binding domain-containing protein [Burkholderiaceae bacterium]
MRNSREPSLDRLNLFVAVAEAGGFTAAAQRLGMLKTALSPQIARLEEELGGQLFTRTTRRVELTEAGRRLYAEVAPLLRGLRTAVDEFGDRETRPGGTLRITAPADYSSAVVGPLLARFQSLYPGLLVELIASDGIVDLVAERIDVAVRLGWLRDSSLRAVKVGSFSQVAVASPAYLAEAGTPRQPADLTQHRWIALRLLRSPLTWRFTHRDGRHATVRVQAATSATSPLGLLGLARGGAGIAVLTDFAAEADLQRGDLQRVLPEWTLPRGGIHLVYPAAGRPPGKVRHFVDFFRAHCAAS